MGKLKIGDHLWRYTGVSILEYEVFGIVDREVGRMYEVRCISCQGHEDCTFLLADTKKDGYRYVDMIGDGDLDYWHKDDDEYQGYHRTRAEAIISRNKSHINNLEASIRDYEKKIESSQRKIKEAKAVIEGISNPESGGDEWKAKKKSQTRYF